MSRSSPRYFHVGQAKDKLLKHPNRTDGHGDALPGAVLAAGVEILIIRAIVTELNSCPIVVVVKTAS